MSPTRRDVFDGTLSVAHRRVKVAIVRTTVDCAEVRWS